MEKAIRLYSNKKVQEEILKSARDREFAVCYGKKGFGKRPDMLQFENDIVEFARNGATSFHMSVEKWKDPMKLVPGMGKKQLDNLRKGYDLLIDIDSNFLEYSRTCAQLIIEALNYNGVENIALKFSGRSGFHIGVMFESFPEKINNRDARLLFPDTVKAVAYYLKELIKDPLKERVMSISDSRDLGKDREGFDPYSFIEIDSLLMTSRHMFRSPYSLNEKSGLVSIPLDYRKLNNFNISKAKIENLDFAHSFRVEGNEGEATRLIIQAFDKYNKSPVMLEEKKETHQRKYEDIGLKIKEEHFPPCIKLILKGIEKDGRKRSVFILLNFLVNMNWEINEIENFLIKWNKKNYEGLNDGYIHSQVNWYKKNKEKRLPPNCENQSYYPDVGVCKPDNLCKFIKNPVNYSYRKVGMRTGKKRIKSSPKHS